jgi:hypothetical protein
MVWFSNLSSFLTTNDTARGAVIGVVCAFFLSLAAKIIHFLYDWIQAVLAQRKISLYLTALASPKGKNYSYIQWRDLLTEAKSLSELAELYNPIIFRTRSNETFLRFTHLKRITYHFRDALLDCINDYHQGMNEKNNDIKFKALEAAEKYTLDVAGRLKAWQGK